MGVRYSSLDPRRTSCAKLGRSVWSSSNDAASVSVRVRDKNRGCGGAMRHFTRPRCSASSAALGVLVRLVPSRRPAHWTRRMSWSTVGTMLRRFRVANVLVCSSDIVVGGGVPGDWTSKEDDECLRPWLYEFTYEEVWSSNWKPLSSSARTTCCRCLSGTRI